MNICQGILFIGFALVGSVSSFLHSRVPPGSYVFMNPVAVHNQKGLFMSGSDGTYSNNDFDDFSEFVPDFVPDEPSTMNKSKVKSKTKSRMNAKAKMPSIVPRTENQKFYVNFLEEPDSKIVFGIGPAGSGKTLFACSAAIRELRLGNVQKIVMTRPIVPVDDEELGFLPGSLIEKMSPWTRPIFDILLEFYKQTEIDDMIRDGVIEISPLAYMRGRTFKHAWIIADEMQNSSPNQMMMLMTRIGEGSKMVITGDLAQSDRTGANGLSDIIRRIGSNSAISNGSPYIRMVELNVADVQRSPIVSKVLDLYGGDKDGSASGSASGSDSASDSASDSDSGSGSGSDSDSDSGSGSDSESASGSNPVCNLESGCDCTSGSASGSGSGSASGSGSGSGSASGSGSGSASNNDSALIPKHLLLRNIKL